MTRQSRTVGLYADEDDAEATKITRQSGPSSRSAAHHPASLVVVYVPMHLTSAHVDLGRRVPINRAVVIGRQDGSELQLAQEDVSRRHARVELAGGRFRVVDLGSRNGTFVNDEPVGSTPRPLVDGDRITIGSTIVKFIQSPTEAEFHDTIYRLKIEDALTQIHNKRAFLETLEKELSRARRHGNRLTLTLFDLDHFKRINDTWGHLAGDAVLRETAALVKSLVRREDCFARYGGEEFALLQPDTDLAGARVAAEKICRAVADARFTFNGERLPVTVSLGVAELETERDDANAFIARADERLYRAKQAGRNRVVAE